MCCVINHSTYQTRDWMRKSSNSTGVEKKIIQNSIRLICTPDSLSSTQGPYQTVTRPHHISRSVSRTELYTAIAIYAFVYKN